MNLGQTMRHGIAWMFVGNTVRQVLAFLFGIVLARLLAPKDFGVLLTIQVFTGLAGFVAGGGMGQALVRAKEATQQDYDIVFTLPYGIEGVAWAIVGVAVYSAFHLYWLATRCLRAKLSGFFTAVTPAAVLNGLLALVLFSTDATLPASVAKNDFAYMALMGAAGGVIYIVSFLYLPFRSLATERERWKIRFKLAKATA